MSLSSIESPKVFISYAWEDDDYKDKVRSFATELRRAGIDVVLDQWDLREGNDMNAFMEASVTDETVTNVLIMLSPSYESKANARAGGVGTETQIISPEVYGKVRQTKFIPVVFLRNPDGSVPKPAYLKSLLHFDLSNQGAYPAEYKRLVQMLYGVEVLPKPELGARPSWVGGVSVTPAEALMSLERIKGNEPPQIRHAIFSEELRKSAEAILRWDKSLASYTCDFKYTSMYLDAIPLRNTFNQVMRCYPYVDGGSGLVADALERLLLDIDTAGDDWYPKEMKKTMVHELFLYFVATMQGYGDACALGNVLARDYQANRYGDVRLGIGLFYHHDETLCYEIKRRDGKAWLSPMAKFWLENVDVDTCSGEAFILADELCFNSAIMAGRDSIPDTWHPKTYIYDEAFTAFRGYANGLRSQSLLEKAAQAFGFKDVEGFVRRFKEVESRDRAGEYTRHRLTEAYNSAPLLCRFVSSDQLGMRA